MNNLKKILIATLFLILHEESVCAKNTQSSVHKINTDSIAMSILEEGIILYRHEISKNIAYDAITQFSDNYENYIAIMNDKETEILYYEIKNNTTKITSSVIINNVYGNRASTNTTERLAATNELKLITAKEAVKKFINSDVKIHIPERCQLSIIILDKVSHIRSYILIEPDYDADIIPLGNDYTCIIKDNKILEFQKLHEMYLPIECYEVEVTGSLHSHSKDNPYITPTEICTLQIYGSQIGMKQFGVFNPYGEYHSYLNIETGELRLVTEKEFYKLMKKNIIVQ